MAQNDLSKPFNDLINTFYLLLPVIFVVLCKFFHIRHALRMAGK